MKSIVFFGGKSIGFSCLSYLVENQKRLGISVDAVVLGEIRNPALSASGKMIGLARERGIEVLEAAPISASQFDFLISVQYHAVLTQRELSAAGKRAINLHMAPLPEYRGANQFSFAILNGEKNFGVTLHEMTTSVDSGPILAERRFSIDPRISVEDLYLQSVHEAEQLFETRIEDILNDRVTPQNQSTIEGENERHFYKKSDIDGLKLLDSSWPIEKIDRYARAFDMPGFEPAYFEYEGRRIYVTTKVRGR